MYPPLKPPSVLHSSTSMFSVGALLQQTGNRDGSGVALQQIGRLPSENWRFHLPMRRLLLKEWKLLAMNTGGVHTYVLKNPGASLVRIFRSFILVFQTLYMSSGTSFVVKTQRSSRMVPENGCNLKDTYRISHLYGAA